MIPNRLRSRPTAGLLFAFLLFTAFSAQRAGVVVLTNMEDVDAGDLAQQILKVLVGAGNAPKN